MAKVRKSLHCLPLPGCFLDRLLLRRQMWSLSAPSQSAACNAYGVDAVPQAQQRTDQMKAHGGTKLLRAMQQSLQCARGGPAGHEPILVLLTDGQPDEGQEVIMTSTSMWNKYVGAPGFG